MTARERAPTVREADLLKMRETISPWHQLGHGWEDVWAMFWDRLPPSISREDVRRFVIPRLKK